MSIGLGLFFISVDGGTIVLRNAGVFWSTQFNIPEEVNAVNNI